MERYNIVRQLGKGSHGSAWLATDVADNSQWVLKRIPLSETTLTKESSVDAVREANMLAQLNHPHIIRFRESFVDSEHFYIVTEYCEGGDLQQLISSAKQSGKYLSQEDVLSWLSQISLALFYLHDRKIIHRDLKPGNIFLCKAKGTLKLGDFGISKMLDHTADLAKTVIGTPYFMSPEVLGEKKGYNSKSDVWALGCVLYELLCLRRAFEGESFPVLVVNIFRGVYEPIPKRYSLAFSSLLKGLLQSNSTARYSMEDVIQCKMISAHIRKMIQGVEYSDIATRVREALDANNADEGSAPLKPSAKSKESLSSVSKTTSSSRPNQLSKASSSSAKDVKEAAQATSKSQPTVKKAADLFKERKINPESLIQRPLNKVSPSPTNKAKAEPRQKQAIKAASLSSIPLACASSSSQSSLTDSNPDSRQSSFSAARDDIPQDEDVDDVMGSCSSKGVENKSDVVASRPSRFGPFTGVPNKQKLKRTDQAASVNSSSRVTSKNSKGDAASMVRRAATGDPSHLLKARSLETLPAHENNSSQPQSAASESSSDDGSDSILSAPVSEDAGSSRGSDAAGEESLIEPQLEVESLNNVKQNQSKAPPTTALADAAASSSTNLNSQGSKESATVLGSASGNASKAGVGNMKSRASRKRWQTDIKVEIYMREEVLQYYAREAAQSEQQSASSESTSATTSTS